MIFVCFVVSKYVSPTAHFSIQWCIPIGKRLSQVSKNFKLTTYKGKQLTMMQQYLRWSCGFNYGIVMSTLKCFILLSNAHDKTKIFMMISVWTNPTAIFILIGARTTEQSQVKHELLFCARVLLGNIRKLKKKKSRILECLLIGYYLLMSSIMVAALYNKSNQQCKVCLCLF